MQIRLSERDIKVVILTSLLIGLIIAFFVDRTNYYYEIDMTRLNNILIEKFNYDNSGATEPGFTGNFLSLFFSEMNDYFAANPEINVIGIRKIYKPTSLLGRP